MKDIGNIVKPSHFCFWFLLLLFVFVRFFACFISVEASFVGYFAIGNSLGGFFQTNNFLPSDEEMDKLLTENAKRFLLFILFQLIASVL